MAWCSREMDFETSEKLSVGKTNVYDVNLRASWGQITNGGGSAQLAELCAALGMPSLSSKTFSKLEAAIGVYV